MAELVQSRSKTEREYCSTSEAAQMLGVSLGTVQQMVENGLLEAWKTAGGHRRIRIGSVESYLRKRHAKPDSGSDRLRVLIAEDDRIMQALYERTLASWEMPIDVKIVSSGFEGLMEIGRDAPDLLVSDLVMPGLDGFAMIRKLRSNPQLADMDIVVVTGLVPEEIEREGGLPEDVIIYGKPIPFRELKGYVQAKLIQLQKRARG
ncbi:response regulator [Uliginosibacterium sp. sgz301328]|uniref:response regulator n=1 Tax=Uliginosibacterium sp. sgz301328 TaxID=3243764 RepID=UPI00359CEB97